MLRKIWNFIKDAGRMYDRKPIDIEQLVKVILEHESKIEQLEQRLDTQAKRISREYSSVIGAISRLEAQVDPNNPFVTEELKRLSNNVDVLREGIEVLEENTIEEFKTHKTSIEHLEENIKLFEGQNDAQDEINQAVDESLDELEKPADVYADDSAGDPDFSGYEKQVESWNDIKIPGYVFLNPDSNLFKEATKGMKLIGRCKDCKFCDGESNIKGVIMCVHPDRMATGFPIDFGCIYWEKRDSE